MAREYDPPPRTRATGRWRSDFDVLGQRAPESDPPSDDADDADDDDVESIQRELNAHPTWNPERIRRALARRNEATHPLEVGP